MNCPLNGNCLKTNAVYQAAVRSKENTEKIYIGLTGSPWKQRNFTQKHYLTKENTNIPQHFQNQNTTELTEKVQ